MSAFGLPARRPLRSEPELGVSRRDAMSLLPQSALSAAALLIVARRLSGALSVPLSPVDAMLCAAGLVAVSAGCKAAAVKPGSALAGRFNPFWLWLPTVSVFAVAAALSLPRTSAGTLAILWSITVCGELLNFGLSFFGPRGGRRVSSNAGSSLRRVRQQLTRFNDAAGRDVVEGTVVARFAPGQRTVSVHLAFCPPFEHAPEIACGAAGDVDAEVKTAQALAYAARFDVKLASVSADAIEVPVSFSARCSNEKN